MPSPFPPVLKSNIAPKGFPRYTAPTAFGGQPRGGGRSKVANRAKTPGPVGLPPPTETSVYDMGRGPQLLTGPADGNAHEGEEGQQEESLDAPGTNPSFRPRAEYGPHDEHDQLPAPQGRRLVRSQAISPDDGKDFNEETMEEQQYGERWAYAPEHGDMPYEQPMMPHPQHTHGTYHHEEDYDPAQHEVWPGQRQTYRPEDQHRQAYPGDQHRQAYPEDQQVYITPPAQVRSGPQPAQPRNLVGNAPPTAHRPPQARQPTVSIFAGDIFPNAAAPFDAIDLGALWHKAGKKTAAQGFSGGGADDVISRINAYQNQVGGDLAGLEHFIADTFEQYDALKTTVDVSVKKMRRKSEQYEAFRKSARSASDEAQNWGGKRFKAA